jgi:phosphoserine aminotransferase
MKQTYFSPGPSQLYPGVESFISEGLQEGVGSISHRSAQYVEIHKSAVSELRKLINLPDSWDVYFLGSASESWERIIRNCISSESYHFVNGSFSKKFYSYASAEGLNANKHEVASGSGFDIDEVRIPENTELITIAHNETSTGVMTPLEDVYKLRELNKDAIIALDVVSSLPFPNIDFSKIDTAYFSVQKCFGMPAGLGVWLVNDKCKNVASKKLKTGELAGGHHNISSLAKMAIKHQTPSTPNVLGIYTLKRVCEAMNVVSSDVIRANTLKKAELLNRAINDIPYLSVGVERVEHRSKTVIVANTEISPAKINSHLAQYNLSVGGGYGDNKTSQIRIANFPAHSHEVVEELIERLKELG